MNLAPPASARRVLAVAIRSRGFGFAVLEGSARLVDWGTRTARASKSAQTLGAVRALVVRYRPDRLLLEDCHAPGSRRHPRICALSERVRYLAADESVRTAAISRRRVHRAFAPSGARTRHEIAVAISRIFPETEGRLPPYREAYMSEDDRLSIFDAVSFALTHAHQGGSVRVPGTAAGPQLV